MFYTLIYLLVKEKVKYGTLFCFKVKLSARRIVRPLPLLYYIVLYINVCLLCFYLQRIDVDFDIMNSNRMYLRIIPLIILSFIISLVTILTGAKILDLIFTKVQNVVPHIDSDQAPLNVLISYGLTFAILEVLAIMYININSLLISKKSPLFVQFLNKILFFRSKYTD